MCFRLTDRRFCKSGDSLPPNNFFRWDVRRGNFSGDFFLMNKLKNAFLSKWIFIIPSVFLTALFLFPFLALFIRSFNPDFFKLALSEQAVKALQLSLLTSTITTASAVILGTPLAYLLARWKFRFKSWIELLIDLPIVLPPSVAGLLLLITFGRRGLFGSTLLTFGISLPFTITAVIVAQTFVAAPLYVRSERIGFGGIDKQLEEAASIEGANQWQLFREVMFPLTSRSILSGIVLTWTRALGEFGATILFAGNLEGVTQTMQMAIYLGFERNLGIALALSVVLVIVSLALLMFTKRLDEHEPH